MSKFDLDKIKQGIFHCLSCGTCEGCPYKIFAESNSGTWCETELKKDINEVFLRFDILIDNKD